MFVKLPKLVFYRILINSDINTRHKRLAEEILS